jgi:DNA repair exonuclease SbcCD ATPase subunit
MIKPEYAVTADGRQLDANTITDSYLKAVNINRNIIVNAQAAQMSLYEVCKGLKEMRDGKLYKELGYQNFEEYCENETGIKYRQAFNFIKIVEAYGENLQPVAGLGTTKLALLASLSEEERTEITESTDLESVSKRELEEKIKEIRSLNTKLDTAENEKESLKEELGQISRERENLYRQVKELEARPIEVTVSEPEKDNPELNKLKSKIEQLDRDWEQKYKKLQEESKKDKVVDDLRHSEELERIKAEYEQKLAETEKAADRIISESDSMEDIKETFIAYFTGAIDSTNRLLQFLDNIDEEEIFVNQTRKFFEEAIKKLKGKVTNNE